MAKVVHSSLVAVFIVLSTIAARRAESAVTNDLTVTLSVTALPAEVVLCRDPTAYMAFGFDEQFEVDIDADNNSATGDAGTDAIIYLTTASQGNSCSPTTPLDTASHLVASLFVWDSVSESFQPTDTVPTFSLDFIHNSITISVPADGPLSTMTSASPLAAASEATYHAGANANEAFDETPTLTPGQSVSLPAADVHFCNSPCSTSASYYNFIDLRSAGAVLAPPNIIFKSGFEVATD